MKERQQNSTAHPAPFLMIDSTDHITGKAGLTPTVTISKDGGEFAVPEGAITEIGNGWYSLQGHATDRDTLGSLILHAEATGADPVDDHYEIVGHDPFALASAVAAAILLDPTRLLYTDSSGRVVTTISTGQTIGWTYDGTYYCSDDDVEDTYGQANVTKWATIQGDATAEQITSRKARARSWATNEINSRLRGGPYAIPFAGTLDPTIAHVAAMLAGAWLHNSRSMEDAESESSSLVLRFEKIAYKTLDEIMSGRRRLTATIVNTGTTAPIHVRKQK